MFGGGERDELAVPAAVQVEIAGAEAVVVDEAEQAAGAAVAEKVSEIEEVAAGVVADVANEVDEIEAGAVVDAANEVEEIAPGAVADANEVEEVAAGAVAEVVANAHIDIEEEEIDLSHVPLHLEPEHPAKFAFMADRYALSPVAANADPAAVAAEYEIANPVAVPAEVAIGGEEEEVVVVEAGAVPAEVDLVVEEEEIDVSHVPLHLEAEHPAKFAFMADRYARSPVAADADPAAVATEHEIANPVAVPAEVVIGGEEEEVVIVEAGAVPAEMVMDVEKEEPVAANEIHPVVGEEEEEEKWFLFATDANASYYKCRQPYCPATRTVTSHEIKVNGEHEHENK